jgi:hypothetical protein
MPTREDSRTVQGLPTNDRRAYQAPRLCCYGDVTVITLKGGMTSQNPDGQGNQKTS